MYSINLTHFSVEEFQAIVLSGNLLPGRRMIKDGIKEVVKKLNGMGAKNLGDVRRLLKTKKDYASLASQLCVTDEYLVVLNREVNSYRTKPMPLEKTGEFSSDGLARFAGIGVKTTEHLYAACLTPEDRTALSARVRIDVGKIVKALVLVDLSRINGVGPVFARILRDMGIMSTEDFAKTDTDAMLDAYARVNADKGYNANNLGRKDVEYCRRFCDKLDNDIIW